MNEGDAGNSNTVFYKQIDAAGNESGVSSYGFDYDATDPSVSGLTSPSGTDTDGDVTFTLTFSEPVDVSTVEETDLTIGWVEPSAQSIRSMRSLVRRRASPSPRLVKATWAPHWI